MSEAIDTFAVEQRKSFAEMETSITELAGSLENIAADEDRQAKQIEALFKQVEGLVAGGGTIGAADLETIAILRNEAVAKAGRLRAAADRAQAIAEAIAEPPAA